MATKDRTALKDEFKNGNLATGERFTDLIDSMKVVQEPVADPAASGTSLSFIDSISQDADGKITATKKTLDLSNAHELNPFKGWYKTGDTLPTDGFDGAYLYFKDTSELTGQTTIYRWNGTTYADTGTVVDTSNVQTFETGQAVNGTGIKDLDGNNDPNAAGVLSAEAGKELLKKIADTMDGVDESASMGGSNVVSKLYIDASTGLWKVPTGNYGCSIIGVSADVRMVLIAANGTNVCRFAFLNTAAAGVVDGDTPDYADGYTNVSTIAAGGSVIVDVPVRQEGKGMYLYIYLGLASNYPYKPTSLMFYGAIMPITIDKVAFTEIVVGKNKLDPDKIVSGKAIRWSDGALVSASGMGASDFIPVSRAGLTCNHTPATPGNASMGYAVYAADKTYIRGLAASGNSATYTYREDAGRPETYVRFTLNMNYQNLMVEEGNAVTSYESYSEKKVISGDVLPPFDPTGIADGSVTIDQVAFTAVEAGKNKLDPNKIVSGRAVRWSDGALVSASGMGASDFIPVSRAGLTCNHTPATPGNVSMGYAVYAADKTYIRGLAASGDSATYTYREDAGRPEAYVRFTLNMNYQNLMVEEGNAVTSYESYSEKKVINGDVLPTSSMTDEDIEMIKAGLAVDKIFGRGVEVLLPERFYYVKGDTLQLFYKGMVRAVSLADKYVKPTCAVGALQYKRYMEVKSDNTSATGNHDLSVTVYDDNRNVLGSGSSKIRVVNAPVSPSSEKKVFCLGDSTTEGGQWVCEAVRRLTGSGGTPAGKGLTNLTFVGPGSETIGGVTGRFYAKSGWGWRDFATNYRSGKSWRFWLDAPEIGVAPGDVYTNNGHNYTVTEVNDMPNGGGDVVTTILCDTATKNQTPSPNGSGVNGTLTLVSGDGPATLAYTDVVAGSANLFWDTLAGEGGDLNFKSFFDTYGHPDLIYIMLSANGMDAHSNDWIWGYAETFLGKLLQYIETYNSGCKVVLIGSAYASMETMMPTYNTSGTFSDTYNIVTRCFELTQRYKDYAAAHSGSVEFESWAAQFDIDNNYSLSMKNVNSRNSTKQEPYGNNKLHPGNAGYMQYGDAAYRSVVAHLCQ